MSEIVKQTLLNQVDSLKQQYNEASKQIDEQMCIKAHKIVDDIDEFLKATKIEVGTERIKFTFDSNSWGTEFDITRRWDYSSEPKQYSPATLNSSSTSSNMDATQLKKFAALGTLCKHNLAGTNEWIQLVGLMDEYDKLKTEHLTPLSTQIYQINESIRDLDNKERENKINNIFKKGQIKFKESQGYCYGNRCGETLYSKHYSWFQNGTGKTYTLKYVNEWRSNPYYDAEGNKLEPVWETREYSLDKRVRVQDIRSFISQHINKIEE